MKALKELLLQWQGRSDGTVMYSQFPEAQGIFKVDYWPYQVLQLGGGQTEPLPLSARGPGSILTLVAVCVEFVCPPCDQLGFIWVLWFLPINERWAGL